MGNNKKLKRSFGSLMYRKIKFESAGKVPNSYLKDIVFKYLGSPNKRVLYGPGVGRDAAAIKVSDNTILVVKSDPITGAAKHIGRFAVIINSNDIAVLGARPLFFTSTILLPINSSPGDLEIICKEIDQASKELNISVIGGHTEITIGIKDPILCGSMLGETTPDLLITANSKPGDKLIMTKSAATEGTAILAWDKEDYLKNKIGKNTLLRAKNFIKLISIVQEAKLAQKIGGISAMHDPTEGGILNGIFEICEAASVGADIYENRIPIADETKQICKIFNLDPLRLIASGTLLMSVRPRFTDEILSTLTSSGIKATSIGKINKKRIITLHKIDGTQETITAQNQDQLWEVFK